jgi:hypothetical protein
MSTLGGTSNAQSFHKGVKSCTRVERGTRGPADNPVRILFPTINQFTVRVTQISSSLNDLLIICPLSSGIR